MLERFTSGAPNLAGRAPCPHGSPRKGCLGAMAGVLPGPHLRGAGSQMQTAQQADLSSICSSRAGRSKGCQPPAAGAFARVTPLLSYRLPLRCRLSSFSDAYPPGAFMAFPNEPASVFAARAFCGFLPTLPIAPRQGFSSVSATARGGVCDPEAVTLPDSSSSRPAGL